MRTPEVEEAEQVGRIGQAEPVERVEPFEQVEQVVLLSESGEPIGTAPKATVHTAETPLHLAFSCYVFDEDRRLLVTRRALSKLTWPEVWTNSCCGHPAPGEDVAAAVRRRLETELGIGPVLDLGLTLPDFRYRAVMDNGVVENEICPVFTAVVPNGTVPAPDPAEVEDFRWIPWPDFVRDVRSGAFDVSPWCVLQIGELTALASDPQYLV